MASTNKQVGPRGVRSTRQELPGQNNGYLQCFNGHGSTTNQKKVHVKWTIDVM
jgi:hypothetical protein